MKISNAKRDKNILEVYYDEINIILESNVGDIKVINNIPSNRISNKTLTGIITLNELIATTKIKEERLIKERKL